MIFLHAAANLNAGVLCQVYTLPYGSFTSAFATLVRLHCSLRIARCRYAVHGVINHSLFRPVVHYSMD